MDTMSVQEAARQLGVTEKTIYRYLDKRKLSSEKIGLVHFIPRSEVEAMRVSGHVQKEDRTYERERIDTLYELLAAHDFRIKQLEEQVRNLKNVQTPAQSHQERATKPVAVSPSNYTPTRDKATSAPRVTRQSAIPEMPPGTLSLQEFSDVLGIARRTLLEQVVKYDLPHTALESNRPGELKRYFDSEQQEAVKQWRAERGL